ncbi:glycoside hydrolase family 3 protein [Hyalangium rubrum]|uniref:beta-N-acetylhexosaminidase n=1 Tax=Hyalangium rubrum TaxID=3103134 RepID=A0ABU5H2A4_9BACT|nr:glycoside hydrolase family 3 N-terminal domain-containing protein [Hyalangium sp. s54d21]MDY7226918.1 glycoside hydrolase family 3 N-terminal domain-containing protein [Hyalangium sp. s54d21]
MSFPHLAGLTLLLSLGLCASAPAPAPPTTATPSALPPPAALSPGDSARVEALLASMSLEARVGQLMMVGFYGSDIDEEVEALVRGRQVGGVCLFKHNLVDAEQAARLNDGLRRLLADHIPPFLALDQEGGTVVRVSDQVVVLPSNMALGATRSADLAYAAGRAQAQDLRRLGFNMNLAPVLDVNLNPRNPVIGVRSYGDSVPLVSELGRAFVRGQQDAGLVTVAKHFPGHGATDIDSHTALPVMRETREEVLAQLEPFHAVIQDGLDGLMTAHVAIPRLTGDEVPATLHPQVLDGLLRRDMGFDGLVLTDEMEMEAIVQRYGVGRAAVMAVRAGADMVLVPWGAERKEEAYEALLAAARDGELSAVRLEQAVRRILTVKVRRGLFQAPPRLEERLATPPPPGNSEVAHLIARASVTLLRTDGRHFPLPREARIAVITSEASLGEAIRARAPHVSVLNVPPYPSAESRAALRQQARKAALGAELVVVGVTNSRQVELVTTAAATGRPVVVVSMGLPYLTELVDEARAVLAVYSFQPASTTAAAAALFGEIGTPGRLPVKLRRLTFGHGLNPVGQQQAAAAPKSPSTGSTPHGLPGAAR